MDVGVFPVRKRSASMRGKIAAQVRQAQKMTPLQRMALALELGRRYGALAKRSLNGSSHRNPRARTR